MPNERNLTPWTKGHSGNPQGVSKARISYRQAVEKAVGLEDFTAIVKALIREAKKGKAWAVREFFDLTLGKNFSIEVYGSRPGASILELVTRLNNKEGEG